MRRDTIFYQIFQQFPTLLFDLIPNPPSNADRYTFDSVEVKETSFRIDGVFSPPTNSGLVYFCEVQFQLDELLYERIVSKFNALSRDEVNAMLGIELQQTRVYQEAKAEGETIGEARGKVEGKAEGLEIGQQQERALVLKQLGRKLGKLSPQLEEQVMALSINRVEALGEALLDFTTMNELEAWLS